MRKIRLQKSADDRLRECFERDLNEPQRAAATAPDGFNLILAGPGSGKTRVVIYRVAYLIARGVPAESILLVTFTRRAAREMVGRLENLIGPTASKVWAGTFHHIANRLLRRAAEPLGFAPNFTILDSEDARDLVKLALADAGLTGTGKMAPKPALVAHLISFAFNTKRPLAEVVADRHPEWTLWIPRIEAAAAAYASRKRAANSMDYDDLLGHWARLLAEFPDQRARLGDMFHQILVDEMQDTNLVQVGLVETIARAGAGNLTAVGDDAQSIYRFRGANYDNILKFAERNPGGRVFRLEVNYRSTPEIVAFTNASINRNESGFPKVLVSARPSGVKPVVVPAADPFEEADFLCHQIIQGREDGTGLGKMAVLYRSHHDSVLIQQQLVRNGIPYTVRSGQRFFETQHIKDVLAYLRIIVNPRDDLAWTRLFKLLPGVGDVKAATLVAHLTASADPLATLATAELMAKLPAKAKGHFAGFVADLRKIRAVEPESHPAEAIGAILQGGYPATARIQYADSHPENRLADVEQLAVLAIRYDSLEKLIADLLLAGNVYGVDSVEDVEPEGTLVLSTIHQAKGLEWSIVFIPRLVEDGFPSARSLNEPGGEDEERRVFYVAVTRAMDELWLTYPLMLTRPGRGGSMIAEPSRFLTEIDQGLYEPAALETDIDLAWTSGLKPDAPSR